MNVENVYNYTDARGLQLFCNCVDGSNHVNIFLIQKPATQI